MKKFLLATCLLTVSFSAMAFMKDEPVNNDKDAYYKCSVMYSENLTIKATANLEATIKNTILTELQTVYKKNKLSSITSITPVVNKWDFFKETKNIYSVQAGNDSIEVEAIIPNKRAYAKYRLITEAKFTHQKDALGRLSGKAVECFAVPENSELSKITITLKNHATENVISTVTVDSNFRASAFVKPEYVH